MLEYEARAHEWGYTRFDMRQSPFWVDSDGSLCTVAPPFHPGRKTCLRRFRQMDAIRILGI